MKIFSAEQIRAWDAHTIQNEPILSIDLMERAALAFVDWFGPMFSEQDRSIKIFCGPGNNGGDGLAIARLLHQRFYSVEVFQCKIGNSTSSDFDINLKRLPPYQAVPVQLLEVDSPLPEIQANDLLIDALFGSGINRPVTAYWATLIEHLNQSAAPIVAVDIPSGLSPDQNSEGAIIKATFTFSFERPKLAFFFPQNHAFTGHWFFQSIGLSPDFSKQTSATHYYVDKSLVRDFLRQRSKFDHKGTYGHALLVVGSYGKVGAAILAARAAFRSGTGLVTVHAPKCAYVILQIGIPEAMVDVDAHDRLFSGVFHTERFDAIGVGCGMGTNEICFEGLAALMVNRTEPLVLDADALNLVARHRALFSTIPKDSILTPHPKEFERLFGLCKNDFERHQLQGKKAKELQCYILLKGANSCLACPDGTYYFNSTGNPGMATGGSGDVLTGILTGLLAQGYSSKQAAILGVYLHGLAGDLAAEEVMGQEALMASDIIDNLGEAFKVLHQPA